MAKIGPYIRLLFIIKTQSCLYRIDRSTNEKYLCDRNFENAPFEEAILKCMRKYLMV